MTRVLLILALAGACAACETDTGRAWYQNGDVSYDALKAADDACKAKGGDFQLKKSGDPTLIGDYECVGTKGS